MPFFLIRNDITRMHTDAVVNAANKTLLGGGGVDGAIHRAAGPKLLAHCLTLGGCKTGEAKITPGFNMSCKYIIHTVGPIWKDGAHGEREALVSCYRSSLALALENGCESVAFPLISAGVYGYPVEEAIAVAEETIRTFLDDHDMTVYLVLFDTNAVSAGTERFREIRSYIDDAYSDAFAETEKRRSQRLRSETELDFIGSAPMANFAMPQMAESKPPKKQGFIKKIKEKKEDLSLAPSKPEPIRPEPMEMPTFCDSVDGAMSPADFSSLEDALSRLDESFTQMLLRKIDESGMTDAQCYKKANIDRKLFSKIRSDIYYKPSKSTAVAFGVALRMPLDELRSFIAKAGFALSHASKFDIIVEYYISRGVYDIFEINDTLFAFDQMLLGTQ
ncbi:MAG: O-acetyl-ADP-ribose deacetylase [Clostridia bacterium]|nr:O-acetyl-ADP-ribose deacetylase [Clostridia bacterium]